MTEAKSWKDRISFLSPKSFEAEVNGSTINFYALSPRRLALLTKLTEPVALAMNAFLDSKSQIDKVRQETRRWDGDTEANDGGGEESIFMSEPMSLEAARWKSNQREAALRELLGMLNDQNIGTIGDLIVDSMRDVFPRDDRPSGLEFIDEVGMDSIMPLVSGMLTANEKVLGPFLGKVKAAITNAAQELKNETEAENEEAKDRKTGSSETTPPPTPEKSPTTSPSAPRNKPSDNDRNLGKVPAITPSSATA